MSTKKCRRCGLLIKWAEAREQFRRVVKYGGLSVDEAKRLMPQCEKCTVQTMAELGVVLRPRSVRSVKSVVPLFSPPDPTNPFAMSKNEEQERWVYGRKGQITDLTD
jgi:hypothetical protein